MIQFLISLALITLILLGPILVLVGFFQGNYVLDEKHIKMKALNITISKIPYKNIAWIKQGSKHPWKKEDWQDKPNSKAVTIAFKKRIGIREEVILFPKNKIDFFQSLKDKLVPMGVEVR